MKPLRYFVASLPFRAWSSHTAARLKTPTLLSGSNRAARGKRIGPVPIYRFGVPSHQYRYKTDISTKMSGTNTGVVEEIEEELPFALTERDRYNLSITDEEFEPHTWEDLKDIVANNRLETLRRWPSDLKRYIKWSTQTKKQYGSVMVFVMKERLKWTPKGTPETGLIFDFESPIPFENPNDYKIMPNDWPYGLDHGIQHLIVWLKNRTEAQPPLGDLTPAARAQVNAFVDETFVKPLAKLTGEDDNIIWFKNWVALQSVPGIDHIHVLIRNVPKSTIDECWTKGEEPLQNSVEI